MNTFEKNNGEIFVKISSQKLIISEQYKLM
jgi:hypothetical protein